MATYPIIPSLSRYPDFATTRKIQDGTLSSPMESGYVTTRPRFTRLRRTWGVTWKNVTEGDVIALDRFEVSTVKGGAGAFYMPNLLENGSFEDYNQTSVSASYSGWSALETTSDDMQLTVSANTSTESASALFTSTAGYSLPTGNPNLGKHVFQSGAVYQGGAINFLAQVNIVLGTLPAGVSLTGRAYCRFFTLAGAEINPWSFAQSLTANTGGFVNYASSIEVPYGAATVQMGFYVFLNNFTGSAVVLDGSTSVTLNDITAEIVSPASFDGWLAQSESIGIYAGTNPADGSGIAQFGFPSNYQLPSSFPVSNLLSQASAVSVNPGDTMQLYSLIQLSRGALPSPALVAFGGAFIVSFDVGAQLNLTPYSTDTAGSFLPYSVTFTVPPGASLATISLYVYAESAPSLGVIAMPPGVSMAWDEVGLSVVQAAQPFGKMPGTSSPSSPVRFTKPLTIKDAKPADGVKRYDVTCEVTEL